MTEDSPTQPTSDRSGPATPTSSSGVWTRIKDHKIAQWTLAYAAAAYALLDGTKIVSDAFDWPHQLLRIVTVLLIVGLPVVVTLAWFHGHRALRRVSGPELTIITVLLVVAGVVLWRFARAPQEGSTPKAVAQAPVTYAAAINDKSIAVLPFVDMSEKHDQEYMSDGIAEELLNLLTQAPGLKVIARTSSFAFKGKEVDIAEVAKRLNVAHVLEGSVRKSGNTIRITAQLIRTTDSTHVWSETYDRPLDDLFKLQDEIAGDIVQALQIRLNGGELRRRNGGTQNLEAYQLYLRGLGAVNLNTRESLDEANGYLEKAIKVDPNYGLAWLQVATVYIWKTLDNWLEAADGFGRARQAAQHALELSPELAEAHAALMFVYRSLDWNWAAAQVEGQRALAIDPSNPYVLDMVGNLSMTLGRWDQAERQIRAALVRDPLNAIFLGDLAMTYYLSGRFREAEEQYKMVLQQAPNSAWTPSWLAKTLLAQGKAEAALAMAQQEADQRERLGYLPIFLQAVGRRAEADQALRDQITQWGDTCAVCVARSYAYRGDHDRALEWLEKAYKQKDAALTLITGEPLLNNLRSDSRYKSFLRKMNLPE